MHFMDRCLSFEQALTTTIQVATQELMQLMLPFLQPFPFAHAISQYKGFAHTAGINALAWLLVGCN